MTPAGEPYQVNNTWSHDRRVRRALGAFAAASVFAFAACAPETVPLSADYDLDSVPRLALHQELRLGSIDDPDYGFSRVGRVAVDADNQLYVYEQLELSIRVYSPDGRLVRRIGRRGHGPGEFESRDVRFGVSGNAVWTYDPSTRRLAVFDRDGTLRRDVRIDVVRLGYDESGRAITVAPLAMTAEGVFIGDEEVSNAAALIVGGGDTLLVPRVRFDGNGHVTDTAGWYPVVRRLSSMESIRVGRNRYRMPQPPPDTPFDVSLPDGRWHVERPRADDPGATLAYISRLDLAGDTSFRRTYRYMPVPYSEAQLARSAARAARYAVEVDASGERVTLRPAPRDSGRAEAAIRARMDWPGYQPPFQGYRLAADGALWLQREDRGESTDRWLILDPEGIPVGVVRLPSSAGFRVAWSRGDRLWTVEKDSLDVPWLVRYRMNQ